MREEQQISTLMVVVFAIGIVGLILGGGIPGIAFDVINLDKVYIDDYQADLYPNGSLNEHFHYQIDEPIFDRIYRSWPYPLSFQELDRPYVETIGFSNLSGTIPYAKNWRSDVRIFTENGSWLVFPLPMTYTDVIGSLAETNEAGCYSPTRFPAGQEEISYVFKMHSPLEQDGEYCHWNLLLADEHLPYQQVTIRVHDPQGYVVQLFVHPQMATEKEGDTWVITGTSPRDALVEVEMLLEAEALGGFDGFPRYVPDVKGKTLSANLNASSDESLEPSVIDTSIPGSIAVKNYSADVYLNGTLVERFLWNIRYSGVYRMLYRSWKTPLSSEELSEPYVEPVRVLAPAGTTPYIKDHRSRTRILSPNGTFYSRTIYDLWPVGKKLTDMAGANEAGYGVKGGGLKGSLWTNYSTRVHPALQCDGESCCLNLSLAMAHLPYRRLAVVVHDPGGNISQLFVHPRMDVAKEGSDWIVSGQSGRDNPLELVLLRKAGACGTMDGFVQPSQEVAEKTIAAESDYSAKDNVFSALGIIMRALVLLAPLLLLLVYRRFGQEKTFVVPDVLSYVPSSRKPWLVNLVFKSDPFDFDKDGLYATILNLQRQGIADIESDDAGGLRIKLLRGEDAAEDEYERKVVEFLSKYAEQGVLDTRIFDARIESLRKQAEDSSPAQKALHSIRDDISDLLAGPGTGNAREFFAGHSIASAMLVALPVILIVATGMLWVNSGDNYPQLRLGFISAILLFIQSLIPALAAPRAIFGKWKADYYLEKQEWDSFRKFLSDFASIQKYTPEDISIWKDWLVYGTALGVADKVLAAMEQLKVPAPPEAKAVVYVPMHFEHAYIRSREHVVTRAEREAAARLLSGGGGGFGGGGFHSGGGGGFGGGGGHGGGGGGAR